MIVFFHCLITFQAKSSASHGFQFYTEVAVKVESAVGPNIDYAELYWQQYIRFGDLDTYFYQIHW